MGFSLEQKIETIREAMIFKAMEEGFNSPLTLELSTKLDKLMNQFDINKGNLCQCAYLHTTTKYDK